MVHCISNLLFFDIPLSYYYTNLNSSIICCLFSGDMYLYYYYAPQINDWFLYDNGLRHERVKSLLQS